MRNREVNWEANWEAILGAWLRRNPVTPGGLNCAHTGGGPELAGESARTKVPYWGVN
jgi:hypothetical protein